jgi:hypothetical protein
MCKNGFTRKQKGEFVALVKDNIPIFPSRGQQK